MPGFAYHKPLVFVDIETTGMSPTRSRILEIAIIRVEQGKIVETLNTVVDPESYIPPTISSMTGITEKDVKNAPTFNDISHDVKALLEGAVFVAHNARFDYSFIKTELNNLGITFSAKRLCTVALSRSLFPKYKRHDLSSIIERFGFQCEHRHRAYDDANVLSDFLLKAEQELGTEKILHHINKAIGSARVPHSLKPELIATLPETPGVYIFYGEQGEKLYIGKSVNIKNRVISHFTSPETGKALRIIDEIRDIETISTSGEMGALLLESYLIKKEQPLYNRMLRRSKKLVVVKEVEDDGYKRAVMETLSSEDIDASEKIIGIFRNLRQAKQTLLQYADEHKLCQRLLGIETGKGACFYSQLGKCNGACCKREKADVYNLRFDLAFAERKVKIWPYAGPIVIDEKIKGEKSKGTAFIIDQWKLVKSYSYDEDSQTAFLPESYTFDYDSYKILAQRLLKPRNDVKLLSDIPQPLHALNY